MMNLVSGKKHIIFVIGAAIVLGFVTFLLWTFLNPKTHTTVDMAYAPNIETLTQSASIVVKGTVLDETESTNLRRDSENPNKADDDHITPGTYHTVNIEEVMSGNMDIKNIENIKVAVTGGSYKDVQAKPEANLEPDHTYVFFLNETAQGKPYFFGAGEPYIFEIEDSQIHAVSNLDYEDIFEDDHMSLDTLHDKIKQSTND